MQTQALMAQAPPWVPPPSQYRRPAVGADRGRFEDLQSACRAHGGLARAEDLNRLLEDYQLGDFVSLARQLGSGELICLRWREAMWVPMFQFDLRDLSVKVGLRTVLSALAPVFDAWEATEWFVRPSEWLGGLRPCECFEQHLGEVVMAARTDRFVVAG
ncbi:hypothetical protein [Ideonella sp.]|uniref:hypothetical protein n=1 Tax=Ideonella sp. TaxID=1929293 RepID=UPI003BB622F9